MQSRVAVITAWLTIPILKVAERAGVRDPEELKIWIKLIHSVGNWGG